MSHYVEVACEKISSPHIALRLSLVPLDRNGVHSAS
jgi:hypothetical protein